MGKRSRKRGGLDVGAPSTTSRAQRDAARERRAEALAHGTASPRRRRPGRTSPEDRPAPPWGSFPLVEIAVFVGILLMVAGFLVHGRRGIAMILCGLALASLGGLELTIREHFGGFRSHTSLLAGAVAVATMTASVFVIGKHATPLEVVPIGAAAFGVAFWLFRQVFMRRTGGVGFRR